MKPQRQMDRVAPHTHSSSLWSFAGNLGGHAKCIDHSERERERVPDAGEEYRSLPFASAPLLPFLSCPRTLHLYHGSAARRPVFFNYFHPLHTVYVMIINVINIVFLLA